MARSADHAVASDHGVPGAAGRVELRLSGLVRGVRSNPRRVLSTVCAGAAPADRRGWRRHRLGLGCRTAGDRLRRGRRHRFSALRLAVSNRVAFTDAWFGNRRSSTSIPRFVDGSRSGRRTATGRTAAVRYGCVRVANGSVVSLVGDRVPAAGFQGQRTSGRLSSRLAVRTAQSVGNGEFHGGVRARGHSPDRPRFGRRHGPIGGPIERLGGSVHAAMFSRDMRARAASDRVAVGAEICGRLAGDERSVGGVSGRVAVWIRAARHAGLRAVQAGVCGGRRGAGRHCGVGAGTDPALWRGRRGLVGGGWHPGVVRDLDAGGSPFQSRRLPLVDAAATRGHAWLRGRRRWLALDDEGCSARSAVGRRDRRLCRSFLVLPQGVDHGRYLSRTATHSLARVATPRRTGSAAGGAEGSAECRTAGSAEGRSAGSAVWRSV